MPLGTPFTRQRSQLKERSLRNDRNAILSIAHKPLQHTRPLRELSVCLINPKFEPSFWGYDFALPLMPGDKRCWVVTGALPALAALVPPNCKVELLDENVDEIDFDALTRFDVVGVTGMVVQGPRMREILSRLKGKGPILAAGGAYVSVADRLFEGLCDVRFVGEADETWPAFLTALAAGNAVAARYEQAAKTDMTTVPAPRYDLLKREHYLMASAQFSRGCPFQCEFCDIITIFGRKPRVKTVEQMMRELDDIKDANFRLCFLVDDNFIGNKKIAKDLLNALVTWQIENQYPLQFYTEASINLADDQELIDLMVQANFRQVFIGIESPRKASLAETRKHQNIRGDSLEAKIQRIRDGGLVVQAGMIVGFDNDDDTIFDEQFEFIQRTGLAQVLMAILVPVPTTPLYDRLQAEGRLDFSDPDVIFQPKLMSRDALKRGFDDLVQRVYEPDAFFARLFRGYIGSPSFRQRRGEHEAGIRGRPTSWARLAAAIRGIVQATKLGRALAREGCLFEIGGVYWVTWWKRNRPLGPAKIGFSTFVGLCVVHWHFFRMAQQPRKSTFGTILPASLREEQPAAA